MNYDEIVKALKEEKKLNEQLGKVGEGVDEQLLSKRRRTLKTTLRIVNFL